MMNSSTLYRQNNANSLSSPRQTNLNNSDVKDNPEFESYVTLLSELSSSVPNSNDYNGGDNYTCAALKMKEECRRLSEALQPDMNLLMHGSGDVYPDQINDSTRKLLADLTVQYIYKLVEAAVDAHDILTDGAGGMLPPPPPPRVHRHNRRRQQKQFEKMKKHRFQQTSQPPQPSSLQLYGSNLSGSNTMMTSSSIFPSSSSSFAPSFSIVEPPKPVTMEEHICGDEYWDEPLPEPKIVKKKRKLNHDSTSNYNHNDIVSYFPSNSQLGRNHEESEEESDKEKEEEWMGAAGIDFFSDSRMRKAFALVPKHIHTQCFIFPICHDAALYGRVMEIQAARRNIAPILLDPVIVNCIEEERQNLVCDSFYSYLIEEDLIKEQQDKQNKLLLQATSGSNKQHSKNNNSNSKSNNNNSNNNNSNSAQSGTNLSEMDKVALENKIRARAQAAAARLDTIEPKLPGLENILPTHR